MIKVCLHLNCGTVYHHCKKENTRCLNCGTIMVTINQKTYRKKFANDYWQFCYQKNEIFRPETPVQLELDI